jgi:hypothetical protein
MSHHDGFLRAIAEVPDEALRLRWITAWQASGVVRRRAR